MLNALCIENFAIVSFLELDFKSGMTAFTGETGAGKSIMIDALFLALGGRAESQAIRPGADKCDISASFTIAKDSLPAQWLTEHEIPNDDNEIILRRVLYPEGRSKSYINGLPFPLQKVKELAQNLVDIHGQHQHQTLLNPSTHRQQVDQFANHPALLARVNAVYQECQNVLKRIKEYKEQGNSEERITLLKYQLEELQKMEVKEGELNSLHEEHQLLHNAREYLEHAQNTIQLLQGDDGPCILQGLNQITQTLSSLPGSHTNIKNAAELINTAIIQCEEALGEVKHFAQQVELDPERLLAVEERMSLLHQLARKFHIDALLLSEHQITLERELDTLQGGSLLLNQLEEEYQQKLSEYGAAADELRKSRQKAAKFLAKEITETMQKLGMPKGYITLDITPLDKMTIHGLDKVEYKVCTNPGMQPDSLSKIASGGELSRISLAIQLITAQRGSTPTLLFDEVDAGIGGATAALVGSYLRKLGQRLQLFCVTHQPQVAACAHNHFFVEKFSKDNQTYSRVSSLNEIDKVNEIARMLGGLTITEQTRSHAQELISDSHKEIILV